MMRIFFIAEKVWWGSRWKWLGAVAIKGPPLRMLHSRSQGERQQETGKSPR